MERTTLANMAMRDLGNDTRGWILCIASGLACVAGASVIYVDILIRLFPGKHNFRIQDSTAFQAGSLSLSFGVMLFSSLYSMLPEAKENLTDAKYNDQQAGLIMMACFVGGFAGIQAFTRFLHQFMPSHVVDCDHTHEDDVAESGHSHSHVNDRRPSHTGGRLTRKVSRAPSIRPPLTKKANSHADGLNESTPLLQSSETHSHSKLLKRHASARGDEMIQRTPSSLVSHRNRAATTTTTTAHPAPLSRKSSMADMQKRVMSFVRDTKCNCGEAGSCYGYTDPCGQECFKHLSSRTLPIGSRRNTVLRTTTGPVFSQTGTVFPGAKASDASDAAEPVSPRFRSSRATSREPWDPTVREEDEDVTASQSSAAAGEEDDTTYEYDSCSSEGEEDLEAQHHHHVPTNAFLSIGLQTSIAIAIHKFPEGFVTYATNHANPSLGLNVFLALFVHNLCEGFTMALPLYMALKSRWRAMAWASLLGGLSQPMGALIAFIVLEASKDSHMAPNAVAYACLFAITAGMMVSVALQLFVESLSLNHNRNICTLFGFMGMVLLGLSNALFAE